MRCLAGMKAHCEYGQCTDSRSFVSATAHPLPVELLYLEATRHPERVDVIWATATETNHAYFEVERSTDGEQWELVATITGAGNSNRRIEYMDADYQAPSTKLYYRLKLIDFDGSYTYSNIAFVPELERGVVPEEKVIQTIPNPVDRGSVITLLFENFHDETLLIVLRDAQGREFFAKVMYIPDSGYYEVTEISEIIPAGTYIITATSKNEMFNNKLIIR